MQTEELPMLQRDALLAAGKMKEHFPLVEIS